MKLRNGKETTVSPMDTDTEDDGDTFEIAALDTPAKFVDAIEEIRRTMKENSDLEILAACLPRGSGYDIIKGVDGRTELMPTNANPPAEWNLPSCLSWIRAPSSK